MTLRARLLLLLFVMLAYLLPAIYIAKIRITLKDGFIWTPEDRCLDDECLYPNDKKN